MSIPRIVAEGLRALAAHRLRTFLMMAGTIVGIGSLVVIMAIGKGTEQEVMKRVNSFGIRLVKINAGGGRGYTKPQAGVATLKQEDAQAIRDSLKGWDIVTCVAQKHAVPMKAGGRECQGDVFAVDSDWHEAMPWPAKEGDGISPEDMATLAHVAVLGTRLAKALFGDESPVGSDIQINNIRFRVKGLLERHDVSPGGDDENDRAVIPLTTGLRRVFNQNYLTYIRVRMKDAADVPRAAEEVRQLMHAQHHVTPPEQDDFSVVTSAEVAEAARGISGTLNALLVALAGLALAVGGVVMMNILLVSVSERTREIGLRRAVGACRRAIFLQFLTEALAVTLAGTAIGVVLGWGASVLLPHLTSIKTVISWEPFALAVVFALAVGLVFGVQPARRAARLSPVDALR
jgi:putative ABC transport system permease protein